ncbi:MAG TPA: hypothetical protein VMS78_11515 [Rhizomicrobium sp.]|nr:hypothetical protein [Rhizomicrobium sp.]
MSRTRWKIPLRCRRCFETGEAILSHQHDGPSDIRVEFIAPGFRVIASDRTPDRIDVLCEHCKMSARSDMRVRRSFLKLLAGKLQAALPKRLSRPARPRAHRTADARR